MDLTEWSEEQNGRESHHQSQNNLNNNNNNFRRNPSGDRDVPGSYGYRNGTREEWDDSERRREPPRREGGRYSSDSASVVSNAVLNHYASFHRRPVNRVSFFVHSHIFC